MYVISGRAPEHNYPCRLKCLAKFPSLLLMLAVSPIALANSDTSIPLSIAEAETIALQAEPGYLALQAEAEAFGERAVAAGQLPDPALRIGVANYPIEDGGFSTEGMTQAQFGFRQHFPRKVVRQSRTDRYEHLSAGRAAGAQARYRDVLAATREAWLDNYYWHRSIALLELSRPFFEDLLATTRSHYALGRKSQFDVLQAELELQRLDDRLIEAGRVRRAAQASLSQWLGDAAYRPIPNVLADWPIVPPVEELRSRLQEHPALQAADARIAAQQSAVDLADAGKKPEWTLDVGYGYREGSLPSGEPRSDFVSLSVTVGLPMFSENRQDRELAAALADRSAARSSRQRLLAELNSALLSEHARWTEHTRRMTLYESQILRTSAASADAALLAYRNDAADVADVLRGSLENLEAQLDYVRLRVERAKSFVALANLGGLSR
ncbi:MAG: TolC family protein [Gammaproteobacteria bacterium]|nr:TolC family protein [Gammaproteobacteria bacterium]